MPPMWSGSGIIYPGWSLFRGTAGDQQRHRHHAVQIAIGLRAPVRLWAERPGTVTAAGVAVAADCLHRLVAGPGPLLLLYVERESAPGRQLDDWCAGRARALSAARCAELRVCLASGRLGHDTLETVLATVIAPTAVAIAATISGRQPAASSAFSDARIAASLAGLPHPLPPGFGLATLAQRAALSPSRYAHLFRAHTGMAVRPYLRWHRLQQALAEIARGASLTEAAHAAGFADSAHLSRSFRRTFGIAPRALRHPAVTLKTQDG